MCLLWGTDSKIQPHWRNSFGNPFCISDASMGYYPEAGADAWFYVYFVSAVFGRYLYTGNPR